MSAARQDARTLQALVEQAAPELELRFRPMFGGITGYVRGKPFASLSDVGLGLKLAGRDREEMLALPGAAPLRYEPDSPPSKQYVVVPEAMLGDRVVLAAWLRRSAAGVQGRGQTDRRPR